MQSSLVGSFWRYLMTTGFVMLFVGIRWILHPFLGDTAQFLLFILPIIIAALLGRFFCGVYAVILCTLAGIYFFINPYFSLQIDNRADFFHVITFVTIGITISYLVEQLLRARAAAESKAIEAERESVESRIAEEYARESEERFRHVADNAPVLIWISDTTKKFTWFNKPWLEFTGRSLDEEVSSTWASDVYPDDLERFARTYNASFDARHDFSMEYRLRRADGEYRWLLENGTPRFTPNGEFLGYIGSCIDIHDRKKAEAENIRLLEEARQAHAQAEVASRLKDEFIGTVSHELRTPLNAILGWTQMMRGGLVGGAERGGKAIEVIERNARSQAQLIEDLLDITRISSGKLRLNVRSINLAQVLEAAIDTVRPAAEAKDIRIEKVLEPNIEAVSGDADRLQQVIWNLLSNAVKFTPQKGRIEVRLEKSGSHIEITVSDTGKGIEPEFLPYVFDRFRQQDGATTRKFGGLGIGLAIVRNIVELHGGTIRAESEGEHQGAAFTVRLPLRSITEIRKTPSGESDERIVPAVGFNNVPELSVDLQDLKVLVVDDEADARDLLSSLLRVYGAEVTACGSAAEALSIISSIKPHILVSDVGMPEMDGYALIKKVRELDAEAGGAVPAIALTAYTRVEDRVRALTQGFQMFVPKPVEPSELVAAVKSLSGLNESLGRNDAEQQHTATGN